MTRMCTSTRTIVTALAVTIALALLLPAAANAQNPANCNANLLDVTISRDKLAAQEGETVNYSINVINRSVVGLQIGCNTLDVTADFSCPGPTGQADGPSTNLFTNADIPANDVLQQFGPFACTMPNIAPGVASAGVDTDGNLDDGVLAGGSPFLIQKEVSVLVVAEPPGELTPIMTARFEFKTPGVPDDRLVWVGQFTPATPIDPATEQVVVQLSELTQCGGTFSSLTIPPGSFVNFQGGKVQQFTGPVTDGVSGEVVQTFIRIVRKTAGTFTIALDLRDADFTCLEGTANLTVETTVDIGGDVAAGETCFGRISNGDLYFPVKGAVCP